MRNKEKPRFTSNKVVKKSNEEYNTIPDNQSKCKIRGEIAVTVSAGDRVIARNNISGCISNRKFTYQETEEMKKVDAVNDRIVKKAKVIMASR